ncbi:MAG: thioredoxin family protein [Elusimicrobia bacterium]|nr:thioredoxin family protein [Elusimicrobiota bacterium]
MRTHLRLSVAGLLLAALAQTGCSGGCGEAPAPESDKTISTSGGSSGGGGSSGRAVGFGKKPARPAKAGAEKTAAKDAAKAPAAPTGPVFEELGAASYPEKVIKASAAVLVVGYTPACAACREAMPAFQKLSQDAAGKVAVYRLNLYDAQALRQLPAGITASPLPALAYYENGLALAQRQGLPFARRKSGDRLENPADYEARLRRWLGQALELKNLNLPEPR